MLEQISLERGFVSAKKNFKTEVIADSWNVQSITNYEAKNVRLYNQTSARCIMNFNIDENHNKI